MTFDMASNHIAGSTYDADWNLLTSSGAWGTTQSTYNALNQRVAYQSGSATTFYAFNASGQRSAIYSGAASTPSLLQNQVYWGGTPVAFLKAGTLSFQFQNWIGTEVFTVAPGASVSEYVANAYGDGFMTVAGADVDPFHFAGLDGDADGTMHAQYRNYHPTYGRWLSPDPYVGSYKPRDPQSFNRYAYAGNDPLANNDTTGLDEFDCFDVGDISSCLASYGLPGGDYTGSSVQLKEVTGYSTEEGGDTFWQYWFFDLGATSYWGVTVPSASSFSLAPAPDGSGGGAVLSAAPSNQPQTPKRSWDADLPNCWAVGGKAVLSAFKNTLDPRPSISTFIGALGGGALTGNRALAVEAAEAAPFVAGALDWNLGSAIYNELENPTPCR